LCPWDDRNRHAEPVSTVIATLLTVIFLVALLAWVRANARITQSGVPAGRVIFQDADRLRPLARPLISRRYGLIGKPDYLVETRDGLVPVEIKSRQFPTSGPRVTDVTQLIAYCILVEEYFHSRPPHGIIAYADRHQRIQYTPQGRAKVLGVLKDIADADGRVLYRNHSDMARCRRCGYREVCDEAL
jgi:CRISPR-associated exonuclease Cas4